jgi:universal stress protein E
MPIAKTILVALGPERKRSAGFNRGVELARRTGAALHLCLFDYQGLIDTARAAVSADVAQMAQKEFIRERMSWLSTEAATLADQGLRVECDVVWSPVTHEAVLGKALDINADLIIRDVPLDRHSPPRLHPSPADWKLLRLAPCSLMLVRPDSPPASRHLLAAVDVTTVRPQAAALNDRLMQNALAYAQVCEADLDLISGYSYVPLESDAFSFAPELYDVVDKTHKAAFDQFVARYPLSADRRHRKFGEPADVINQCAVAQNADLVVIGAAYHSAWDRLLFGSTAESLLRQLGCDALILKPDNFREELGRHLDLNALRRRYRRSESESSTVERE